MSPRDTIGVCTWLAAVIVLEQPDINPIVIIVRSILNVLVRMAVPQAATG